MKTQYNNQIPLTEKLIIRMVGGDVPPCNKGFWMFIFMLYNEIDSSNIFRYMIDNKLIGRRLLQTLGNDFTSGKRIDFESFVSHCRRKLSSLSN